MKSALVGPNEAQTRQDAIFRRMSADKKIAFGAKLWLMAKELAGEKFTYVQHRSPSRPRRRGAHSYVKK